MLADSDRGQGWGWSASTRAGRRHEDARKSHHPGPNTGRHGDVREKRTGHPGATFQNWEFSRKSLHVCFLLKPTGVSSYVPQMCNAPHSPIIPPNPQYTPALLPTLCPARGSLVLSHTLGPLVGSLTLSPRISHRYTITDSLIFLFKFFSLYKILENF